MGRLLRSSAKPACISLLTALAWARAAASFGQSWASGKASAKYSQIARDSQTSILPWRRNGTLPEGECFRIFALLSFWSRTTRDSSKGLPVCFRASQGLRDQEE